MIADLTAGTMSDTRIQELLRWADSRGMSAAIYAILRTATQTDHLIPLLALLEPPQAEEQTQLDRIVTLLEQIADSQLRLEHRILAVESALAARHGTSPRPSANARAGSQT